MKRLHLIRHAKSSWAFPELSDAERPLNRRGINSCGIMAPVIKQAGCPLQRVYSSSATRAVSTINLIAEALPEQNVEIVELDALYSFDVNALLNWIQELPEQESDVVLVGHNPAFNELANLLTGANITNIPTAAYVAMTIKGDICWQALDTHCAILETFIKPKSLMSS